jgi:hypothetical protein
MDAAWSTQGSQYMLRYVLHFAALPKLLAIAGYRINKQ